MMINSSETVILTIYENKQVDKWKNKITCWITCAAYLSMLRCSNLDLGEIEPGNFGFIVQGLKTLIYERYAGVLSVGHIF